MIKPWIFKGTESMSLKKLKRKIKEEEGGYKHAWEGRVRWEVLLYSSICSVKYIKFVHFVAVKFAKLEEN